MIPRKNLSEERKEEINKILVQLQKGQLITVVYYRSLEQEYRQHTGRVSKVDAY